MRKQGFPARRAQRALLLNFGGDPELLAPAQVPKRLVSGPDA